MQQPWKLRVIALCLATGLSGVSAQDFTTSTYDTTTGTETSTEASFPIVEPAPSTDVALPETTSAPYVQGPASSATSEAQVEIQPTSADKDESTRFPVFPQPESTPLVESASQDVSQLPSTETQPEVVVPSTETQPLDVGTTTDILVPINTATGSAETADVTTGPVEAPTEPAQSGPAQDASTEQSQLVIESTTDVPPPAMPESTQSAEPTSQVVEQPAVVSSGSTEDTGSTQDNPAPEHTTETSAEVSQPAEPTTQVQEPPAEETTTEDKPQEVSTESAPIPVQPTTENEVPQETTEEEAPKESSEAEIPEQTSQSEEPAEPTQDGPDPKPTEDKDDAPSSDNQPGQTSAHDEPRQTTAKPEPSPTEDGIVTGTNGAVVTYVPEQDKDFSDFTGTTTTTDDGGAAIVLFPGGWFWKPSGNLPAGILPPPPAVVPGPPGGGAGGGPGGNGDGNNDDDDDDDKESTKKEEKSTTEQTTAKSTEATTTSTEGCSAVEIEDCTRTISYFTTDGTLTHTEFGDCPTIASCATGTQATATTTVSAEVEEGVEMQIDEADIDIPDNFNDPVSDDTASRFEEIMDEYWGDATSAGTETSAEATTTAESTETTSETKAEETTTAEATTENTTSVPSTLITKTRKTESSEESSGTTSDGTSSDTITSMISSTEVPTTTTSTQRTYYPCVPHGGPRVEKPYCACETTSDGKQLVATAPMVSYACDIYTEFPMSLYTTPPPAPTPTIFNEPYTQTDAGTVLVWQSYSLREWKIMSQPITNTIGLGAPSTVSTPVPTATDTNGSGSDICSSSDKNVRNALASACDKAISRFEDDKVYDKYTGRYEQMGSILKVLTFGEASCVVQWSCDDYGIGMKGSDIKRL
ncbi:hypothetical protein NW768_010962 [Fusarium equiseti]|uniref:Uncharacterized protein n=1 Tax=Fusarium equiseti TaxID=61235 RepID=A0ABQ8QZQ3_FUSEQ|nr:hypothetical protein NW768_010962 [Fusarium equiseti]